MEGQGTGETKRRWWTEAESLPRHRRGINLSPFSPLAAQRDAKKSRVDARRWSGLARAMEIHSDGVIDDGCHRR